MRETLLAPKEWAEAELGSADVGDARRARRLVRLGEALAASPSGTLPSALPDWASLKAAYRLLGRPEVDHGAVVAAHVAKVRGRCAAGGHCLLIEDTTQLDFTSHKAAGGLGRIGDDGGRGLWLHTTLAVSLDWRGMRATSRPASCWGCSASGCGRGARSRRAAGRGASPSGRG